MFHITYRSSAGVSSVASASATDRTIIEWIQELCRENKHITEITLDADEIGIIDRRLADLFRLNFADNHHLIDNLGGFGVLRGFSVGLLIRLVLLLESVAASTGRARDFQDGGQLQADLVDWELVSAEVGEFDAGHVLETFETDAQFKKLQSEAVPGRQWINPNKYPFYVPMNGQAVEWFDSKFTNHFIKFVAEEGRPGEVVTKEQIIKWRAL